MGLKYILPLFLSAVLIGWFMPVQQSESANDVPHIANAESPSQNVAIAEEAPEIGFGEITLKREANGHFFANANVNGSEVRFMVDTGASVIALTASDAEALGLEWTEDDLQKVGRGVNGDVIGKAIMLENVTIGGIEARNVAAIIVPEGLDISLLGQSFLSKVPNVNISGDKMTFG